MKVFVVSPYGFCEGVVKALAVAAKAQAEHPGVPVYLLGGLVHNESVLRTLRKKGFVLCDEKERPLSQWLNSLKENSIVVFSAHGHDPSLIELAAKKKLVVYDATCRFVRENANTIQRELDQGGEVIYIGEARHAESEAAVAINPERIFLFTSPESFDFARLATDSPLVVAQTTMSATDLLSAELRIRTILPKAKFADRRCFSTENRQKAILSAPQDTDLYLVLGSATSNNTRKLLEIATKAYPKAKVERALNLSEAKRIKMTGYKKVAIASGASTSPTDFSDVLSYFKSIK